MRRLLLAAALSLAACAGNPAPRDAAAPPPDGAPPGPDAAFTADAAADAAPAADAADALSSDACAGGCLVPSAATRALVTDLPPSVAELVTRQTGFVGRLHGQLRSSEGNLFYSPYSIALALAMTYAGARGETATQIATAVGLDPAAHAAFNALDQELARRSLDPGGSGGGDVFALRVVSALWGQRGTAFRPEFLDLLTVNYAAGLRVLDFAADPGAARAEINRWVADQTAGRIVDLLPPTAVRADTTLVLGNAISFKASWATAFPPAATGPRPFTLRDAQAISVPTMEVTGPFRAAETADLQAVELGYVGNKVALLILLPRPGRLDAVEAALAQQLAAATAALAPAQLHLTLPKFSLTARLRLVGTLGALGMPIAFTAAADFSGITAPGGLTITDVVHQAVIAVDEKGTEAAAATAVVVGPPSGPPPATDLFVDRPFLFFVRDKPTGAILFAGRLDDPR